jgi:hypothetical protein
MKKVNKYTHKYCNNKRLLNKKRRQKRKYQLTRSRCTKVQKGGIMNEEVSCLIHGTSLKYFDEILKSDKLQTSSGDTPIIIKGFTEILNKGIFMSLILKCDTGTDMRHLCSTDVFLVFSKDILQNNFHITNEWVGGMQVAPLIPGKVHNPRIRTYDNIEMYIADNTDTICKGSKSKNEVVFYDNISLDNLVEIWICNVPEMQKRINTKLPNGSFSRKFVQISFSPYDLKSRVEQMLTAHNKNHIPVKIIETIPDVT